MLIPNRFRIVGVFAVIACAFVLAVTCGGCGATGPSSKQDLSGQSSTNSPLNKAAFVDGPDGTSGTTTFETAGPVDIVKQTAAGTEAKSSGQVTRTLTVERPDGLKMTLRSGSDAEGSVKADAQTGNVTDFTFKTNSAAPLTALATNAQVYQDTVKALSADTRAVYEAQTQAFVKSVEAVNPTLATLIKGLLGVP